MNQPALPTCSFFALGLGFLSLAVAAGCALIIVALAVRIARALLAKKPPAR